MKWRSYQIILVLLGMCIIAGLTACDDPKTAKEEVIIPFSYQPQSDAVIQKIIGWEQMGKIDSLLAMLSHNNPAYRYQALHAFMAPRYSVYIDSIYPLLSDREVEVRRRAIYTIGQQKLKASTPKLMAVYNPWDSLQKNTIENSLILEAIGKCGDKTQLDQLTAISTFSSSDIELVLGQARGVFQLLLKGFYSDESIALMTMYFFNPQYDSSIRRLAGYYLMRGRDLDLSSHEFAFGKILRTEEDEYLRTCAAAVMANSGSRGYTDILIEQIDKEKNDLVLYNMMRALLKMPYSRVKEDVYDLINHENPDISRLAARFFVLNGEQDDAAGYWDESIELSLEPITQANMAIATIKNVPFYYAITRDAAMRKITELIENTQKDPYLFAQLLQAVAEMPEQSSIISDAYSNDAHPIIKSQSIFALQAAAIRAKQNNKYIGTVNQNARRLFSKVLTDGDVGALAAMCNVLRDTISTNFHTIFRGQQQLEAKLSELKLPEEIETYNEIVLLLKSYGNKKVRLKEVQTFKPFDSNIYKSISNSTRAVVSTTSGEFKMKFQYLESPISAVNFIQLANSGYFNGKVFHRVVPNFVIQTGCTRGDGYGSMDYAIRSELGPLYYDEAGKVGMASAGIDTESSQWFVTHLPVFHLDGRYTIFAQITEGLNVVESIKPGDRINSIEIIK